MGTPERLRRSGCALVMSTGVVSLDLDSLGWTLASRVLLAAAVLVWVWLAACGVLAREIAGVAATGVVGTRLTVAGSESAGALLLALGAALFAYRMARMRLPPRASGLDLLPVVAAQSLGVLCGTLAGAADRPWLRVPGVAVLVLGLLLYARTIARFDRGSLLNGEGDQWIAGGALAISTLACATLTHGRVEGAALGIAAAAWLPFLLAGELRHPRPGDRDRRWATVFPVAMYGAAAFELARIGVSPALRDVADVFAVAGLAVYLATLLRWLIREPPHIAGS
jgi:hypothetical protein